MAAAAARITVATSVTAAATVTSPVPPRVRATVKPWTAATRLGRAFLTPSAPGLISRHTCEREDLSCFFRPLGPAACEPAPPWLPQMRLNLPQQHRESLAAASSLPATYRALGPFWWTAQLLGRLMEPNAAFDGEVSERER